jgi:ABC-type transporter Mla MlaB component
MSRAVYDDGVLRIAATSTPPGLVIAGEIDESNYRALVGNLAEFASGAAEFHVNLADVQYCDLAGLRAIVALASAGRGGQSRQVVLHDVPRQLRTALRLAGWDATPGLVVAD